MKYNDLSSKISGIYKINFPNQKIYIGRTKDIKARIKEHFVKEDNTACFNALRKYYSNYQDIEFEILEELETYDFELICNREKYWIEKFNSYKNKEIGYNNAPGGEGGDFGTNNPASKISDAELNEIISLL